eukprot:110556-Chlamydomonas_euryale.AAC.1
MSLQRPCFRAQALEESWPPRHKLGSARRRRGRLGCGPPLPLRSEILRGQEAHGEAAPAGATGLRDGWGK